MKTLKKTVDIKATPEAVYSFLTHPANLPSVWPSLVEVKDVEHRPDGAHAFNFTYKMAGIPLHGRTRTTHVETNRLVISESEGGVKARFTWTYEPTRRGTKLTCSVEYTMPTPVIGKIAETVVAKLNEHELDVLLANTKAMIEASARPQTAAMLPAE